MNSISAAGITLNPDKFTFGKSETNFWRLIISKDGITADPDDDDELFLWYG